MTNLQITTKIKKANNLKYRPARFTNRGAAFRFAANCKKSHLVILGADQMFWVVCFADAQRLTKNGYQLAK